MAKYKEGDVVIIRNDLDIYTLYNGYHALDTMINMKNDCAIRVISEVIIDDFYDPPVYRLEEQYIYDVDDCIWTESMFEGLYAPIKVSTDDLMAFLGE